MGASLESTSMLTGPRLVQLEAIIANLVLEATGETASEELRKRIFSEFCIGK